MIPSDIQSAKQKINIVDIIQHSGVGLTKHGMNYFGLCPFHSEKTASFSVNEPKQMFHCFGCGTGGDVVEYVQKYYNLDFPGALQFLGIQDNTPETKAILKRHSRTQFKIAKRKAEQKKLYDEFITWLVKYRLELTVWINVINESMRVLNWNQVKELSELVKQKSIWEYHVELISAMDDEAAFELYEDRK